MRKLILTALIALVYALNASGQFHLYDLQVKDIKGYTFHLGSLKGKKVLIVNTASKCSLTPQYEELEKLYKEYGGDNFTIIGFPCNDFGSQDPGTNSGIETFCRTEYGVTFPIMSKISIKGEEIHPVYQWLTKKSLNGVKNSKVIWNFQKYMISEEGELLGHVSSIKSPFSKEIIKWLSEEE